MIERDRIAGLLEQITVYNDVSAYKMLYTICFPALTRFAYSFIKSRELAEEIASDVLVNIWNRRDRLHEISDFRLYLYISTRNASLNELKKQQRLSSFSLDESAVWMKADDTTPEQLFITAELFKRIQTAIQQLPPQCRLIYKLIKEDGLKYKEAAELLHLSVKTIEAQMGIAMKRLYEVFRHSMQEQGSPERKNISSR
jgi:RNA polymerase sigma-70 factor (ECF subfamily)